MALEVNAAKQACQQVNAKMIKQTQFSIMYILNVVGCDRDEKQYQIAKVFNGNDAVYAVRYSAVIGQVNDLEFKSIAKVIQTSKLISNPMLMR